MNWQANTKQQELPFLNKKLTKQCVFVNYTFQYHNVQSVKLAKHIYLYFINQKALLRNAIIRATCHIIQHGDQHPEK